MAVINYHPCQQLFGDFESLSAYCFGFCDTCLSLTTLPCFYSESRPMSVFIKLITIILRNEVLRVKKNIGSSKTQLQVLLFRILQNIFHSLKENKKITT